MLKKIRLPGIISLNIYFHKLNLLLIYVDLIFLKLF